MFTGIIVDCGKLLAFSSHETPRLDIATSLPPYRYEIGASVACSGICLTVMKAGKGQFSVDIGPETLSRTTARFWHPGRLLNIEPALRLGDSLGGHMVFGHVDRVVTVLSCRNEGKSRWLEIDMPHDLAACIVEKGSVTLDGVALTVASLGKTSFSVMLIPHSLASTTLARISLGDSLNLEVDMLARYVARACALERPLWKQTSFEESMEFKAH